MFKFAAKNIKEKHKIQYVPYKEKKVPEEFQMLALLDKY